MNFRTSNVHWSTKDGEPVSGEQVKKLLEERSWSNAQLARFIGVERWTVGSWVNETRSISEKHQTALMELIRAPKNAHPIFYPLASKIAKEIQMTEDSEAVHVEQMAADLLLFAGIRLGSLDFRPLSNHAEQSFQAFIEAFDDHSIARLASLLSNVNLERVRNAGLTAKTYAEEVVKKFPMDGTHALGLEIVDGAIIACYSKTLEIDNDEIERHPDVQDYYPTGEPYVDVTRKHRFVEELKKEHEKTTEVEASELFDGAAFEPNSNNDQWISEDCYSVEYAIQLDDPKFKESLKLICKRMHARI